MKVLVTGGTGFIGSHLVDLLIEKGYDVRCNIRKTSNIRWLKDKQVELVEASLYNDNDLKALVKDVDTIYHVAGVTFAKNKIEFFKGNRDVTKNLISACYKYNPHIKRFLFVSSQTVAGPAKSIEEPVTEDMPCNPITTYGESKKEAEDEVMKYKDKLPITVVRAPAVYGPRDTAIFSVFKAISVGIGTMVGLSPKYVSLIYSKDLVNGIYQASVSKNTLGQIYFVSSEKYYTWNEIIPKIQQIMGKKFVLKLKLPHFLVITTALLSEITNKFSKKPSVFNFEKGKDFIQDFWICSVEKAKNDFNFKQNISLEEGLKQTIDWYKSQGWLR